MYSGISAVTRPCRAFIRLPGRGLSCWLVLDDWILFLLSVVYSIKGLNGDSTWDSNLAEPWRPFYVEISKVLLMVKEKRNAVYVCFILISWCKFSIVLLVDVTFFDIFIHIENIIHFQNVGYFIYIWNIYYWWPCHKTETIKMVFI